MSERGKNGVAFYISMKDKFRRENHFTMVFKVLPQGIHDVEEEL
jgi:hypothetical protein